MSNRMTLDGLVAGVPEELAGVLSAEELYMLGSDLKAEQDRVKSYDLALKAVLAAKYHRRAASERGDEEYGTARVNDGEYVAVSNVPKKVDWDQAVLAEIVGRIRASNDKPEQYVKIEYSIEEKKWNSWPESLKAQFLAARSVKAGTETIKLEKRK